MRVVFRSTENLDATLGQEKHKGKDQWGRKFSRGGETAALIASEPQQVYTCTIYAVNFSGAKASSDPYGYFTYRIFQYYGIFAFSFQKL